MRTPRRRRPTLALGIAAALCAAVPALAEPIEGGALPALQPALRAARTGEVIGTSVQGRPISAQTIGDGPVRVYVIGSIHGDEPESLRALDAMIESLEGRIGELSASVRIVRDANPDGTAAGRRTNARGVDLNRNWPASNHTAHARYGDAPLSEPETAAVHRDLTAFDPHLILALHSAGSGPFVDPDGPGEAAAHGFVRAAKRTDARWYYHPDFTNPAGSLGSYLGLDRGAAVLTVEFRRGDTPEVVAPALAEGILGAITAHRDEGRTRGAML